MRTVVSTPTVSYACLRALVKNHMLITLVVSNPCHIELILTEGEEVVQKSPEVVHREQGKHLTSRQRGQRRAITAA